MPMKAGELEGHLAKNSYISGFNFSQADVDEFNALAEKPKTPSTLRWYKHISFLIGNSAAPSTGAAPAAKKAAAPAAKPAAADDVDDMFADEEDEDALDENGETAAERKANAARRERMESARKLKEAADAKKNEGKAKAEKSKPVEKSLIVLDVKPWEASTDLEAAWHEIIKFEKDGLTWGATFKFEPIAYGIKKLVMTCTIEDAKIVMDDITEHIESFEDWIQSVTVASFNKI